jgi:hypothetical protein
MHVVLLLVGAHNGILIEPVQFAITSLELLFTDTEGYDATLLSCFPFGQMRPNRIFFEYKHADGTCSIGRNLGHLLILLDERGYDMRMAETENCLATLRAAS